MEEEYAADQALLEVLGIEQFELNREFGRERGRCRRFAMFNVTMTQL